MWSSLAWQKDTKIWIPAPKNIIKSLILSRNCQLKVFWLSIVPDDYKLSLSNHFRWQGHYRIIVCSYMHVFGTNQEVSKCSSNIRSMWNFKTICFWLWNSQNVWLWNLFIKKKILHVKRHELKIKWKGEYLMNCKHVAEMFWPGDVQFLKSVVWKLVREMRAPSSNFQFFQIKELKLESCREMF